MKKLILLAGSAALALILCRCADEPQGPVTLSDDALYTCLLYTSPSPRDM